MTCSLDESALCERIPVRRFGSSEKVAALTAFIVSPEAGYITGQVISINRGDLMNLPSYTTLSCIFFRKGLIGSYVELCVIYDEN